MQNALAAPPFFTRSIQQKNRPRGRLSHFFVAPSVSRVLFAPAYERVATIYLRVPSPKRFTVFPYATQ